MIIYYDSNPFDLEAAPGKGFTNPNYALVGIAPSPNRPKERYNEPFGASSYKLLQEIIKMAGKNTIYVTNLIKTPFPPEDKPSNDLVRYNYPYLLNELKTIGVTTRVLALGVAPAEVLCPGFKKMREDHGTIFWNPELELHVIPTFHFSAVARDQSLLPWLYRDIQRFFQLPAPQPLPYQIVEDLDTFEFTQDSIVVLDIETEGLALTDKIMSLGFKKLGSNLIYQSPDYPTVEWIRSFLKKAQLARTRWLGHNFQFDLLRLTNYTNFSWLSPVVDTMLMAHNESEPVLSLKHLTTVYTNRPGSHAFGGPADRDYLSEDVQSTEEVYFHFKEKMGPETYVHRLMGNLVPIMVAMQKRGVYIDRSMLLSTKSQYVDLTQNHLNLMNQKYLRDSPPINWNSPPQAAPILLAHGVPLTEKTKKGAISLAEPVLQMLDKDKYPIIGDLLQLRDYLKTMQFLKSYHEDTTDDHPLLHPQLKLHGTETGRLSCSEPNLQQVQRVGPIKLIFKSRLHQEGGKIGLVDLSQAELRVAAMLSGDTVLAEALESEDVHRYIAAKVFQLPPDQISPAQRKKSKGVTFGLLYGGSPFGLAAKVGVSPSEVQGIIDVFFSQFPKLARWLKVVGAKGVQDQRVVTLTGRVRDLSQLIATKGERDARRKAVNTPVQSLASDIMLIILWNIVQYLMINKLKSRPLFTVHDSTIMEVYPGEEQEVIQCVRFAFQQIKESPIGGLELYSKLPIVGELKLGNSWAEVESTNENYNPLESADISNLE